MRNSLSLLKGGYIGGSIGECYRLIGLIMADTRRLDCGSYRRKENSSAPPSNKPSPAPFIIISSTSGHIWLQANGGGV